MRLKKLSFFLLFLFVLCSLKGQKYSNEFLSIGVGARAQALGNAVVGSTADVTAAYWNPAGLVFISEEVGLQLGAMHSEWFAGIGKYDFIGMTVPFADNKSRIGISIVRFGIDNIPNTLSLYEDDGTINYDNITAFSAADYAFLGSYARKLNANWAVGGNLKIVRRNIGTFASSWGFGLDFSLQYRKDKWRIGLLGRDITTTYNSWVTNFTERERQVLAITGNDIPINSTEITRPSILFGVGYAFEFGAFSVIPELDLVATTDGKRNVLLAAEPFSVDPAAGIELLYNQKIAFRAGVNQFQRQSDFERSDYWTVRPSLGVGLQLSNLVIDYAFTDVGDSQNTFSHIISLMLNLKKKK
ncbi:MAG: PorV/PorQ family protein [Bacteroidota bacterium]